MTESAIIYPNFGRTYITLDGQETELSLTQDAEYLTSEQIADHYDANGPVVWEADLRRVILKTSTGGKATK